MSASSRRPPATQPSRQRPAAGIRGSTSTLSAWRLALPSNPRLRSNLLTARVVLGHTRWATQGARTLGNASPMAIGDIIGTHNGDVTAPTIRTGSTDSAWLFGQLDRAGSTKATGSVIDRTARPGGARLDPTVPTGPGVPGAHHAVPAGHRNRPGRGTVVQPPLAC